MNRRILLIAFLLFISNICFGDYIKEKIYNKLFTEILSRNPNLSSRNYPNFPHCGERDILRLPCARHP